MTLPSGTWAAQPDLFGGVAHFLFHCPKCGRSHRVKPANLRGDPHHYSVRVKCPRCKTKTNYAPKA